MASAAYRLFLRLSETDFCQLNEKHAVVQRVENIDHTLFLVFQQFVEPCLFHQIQVFVRAACTHVFQQNLLFLFPLLVTDEKRSRHIVCIVARRQYGLMQVVKGGLGIYFDFSDKIFYFIRDNGKTVYHGFL